MPLVANGILPSFERLRQEGELVLSKEQALGQDIRELHIGLLNMMPDNALAATERQFFRLVGECNQIAQFYMHPFSLEQLPRSAEGREYVARYYTSFADLKKQGLDALIISGANVQGSNLTRQPFWQPLIEVIDWAYENVTSTLCSCLATHAVLQFRYDAKRHPLPQKRWGVFPHRVLDRSHPLVAGVNTRFDVPHSRFNEVYPEQFTASGLHPLVVSMDGDVHIAVSEDGIRLVFFQAHPEYDVISLLKEYKRELFRYYEGERENRPPFPENYFNLRCQAILYEYQQKVEKYREDNSTLPEFPEKLLLADLDNTWHDTAEAIINNWIGIVYQLTDANRHISFRSGVDPQDPLRSLYGRNPDSHTS